MSTFNPEGLNFSESALNHFKQMLDTRGKGAGIKIGVKEAGCSGYEYTFDFVDDVCDDYLSFHKENCTIFVDNKSLNFLKGSLVDYVDEGLNKGIKFVNPNAKAVCGCGESFTV
ncbi:MAG: iron-sulfur cluster assembly protein IscA [Gammaproteobacteria bacterium]|mgnify:FL=1|nr:iron-sulfur cluster assembly protein IscA [Gammaproteobacteria bacterium]|tara:strand:+ start:278 stop:619 length:342 start_codon:yes stop_codon:yes gene_type:complete